MKTHYSIFAVAWIQFHEVQRNWNWFWKVQSIFIPHNFHVRKEYDLHHPKPDLASLDGKSTTINTCFLSIFLLSTLFTLQCTTYLCCKRESKHGHTMAPPPPSTKSWQNLTRTRDTLAKKLSTDSWSLCTSFQCNDQEKEQVITKIIHL